MGHETWKRGATSSGANSPAIMAFLQKGGQVQKILYLCDFFFAEPIFAYGMTPKINLFFVFFFCGQQHLVPEIKYFRKSLGFVRHMIYIACRKPLGTSVLVGESGINVPLLRVGQLPLCSQVLLLPLGVPPMPVPAMLHTKSFAVKGGGSSPPHLMWDM